MYGKVDVACLKELEVLNLAQNKFTGELGVSGLSRLELVSVHENFFNEHLPQEVIFVFDKIIDACFF